VTKHPSQASKTPPRTAQGPEQAPELHPCDSEPANRPWRVWRPPTTGNWWATYTPCTSPDDLTCPCDYYPTWQEAIAYVNRQIQNARALQDRINATNQEAGQ